MENAINKYCPRSGKPVANDSLTEYKAIQWDFATQAVEIILQMMWQTAPMTPNILTL